MIIDPQKVVKILYQNYRGEISYRDILPGKIWFGATNWHKEEQWLLEAHDIEKGALRNFAIKDVQKWISEASEA